MGKIVMFKKIACLVMVFIFLNATLSYSYEGVESIEGMKGFITYADANYSMLIDSFNPPVEDQFNKDKGVIFITDDEVYFAFPGKEEVSALLLKGSTGESRILSFENPRPLDSFDWCRVLEILFLLGVITGYIFVDVLFLYIIFCM